MGSSATLKKYQKKRNFAQSPEPSGEPKPQKKHSKKDPIFVIQKHDASHLHYDFRIEMNGVLKSWAVPKGFPISSQQKRLAIETEDHPLGYATFEGIIPEGNYGAGSVKIWDKGTVYTIKEEDGVLISLSRSYEMGRIEVCLHGDKVYGEYALIKMKKSDKKNWLLIKMKKKQE